MQTCDWSREQSTKGGYPCSLQKWWIRSVQMFRNTWETTARVSLRPWGFGMHWEMNGLEHRLGPLHQRWHKTCIASDLFTREFELRIYVSNMRFLNGWQPARFELRTYAFLMNFFISKMRSVRHGWQPARPSKWTCARSMAGNQHSLEKEHAFGWWLANLSFSPTSSLSPNVCPWSAHDLPMVAPIFTGGHCKNAKTICTCNFFSIFQKFWKIAIFFEKNRFF